MDKDQKEFTIICEFTEFCHEIVKNDKGIKNLYRIVSPDDVTAKCQTEVKQAFSTYFTSVTNWTNFTGTINYKTGTLNVGKVEKKCCENEDDKKTFDEYMALFKTLYSDVRKNLQDFISKLNLEEGSPEANFMTNLFNEIGGEILETIKSGGGTKDIATLLPRVFEMVKSGKIMQVFEKLKDGSIKISKILKAFVVLVEEYENDTSMKIENTATSSDDAVSTQIVED